MTERLPGTASPLEAALLCLSIMDHRQKEDGKRIGRFRLSQKGMRGITGRTRLSDEFVRQFVEHLDGLGWGVVPDSGGFGFIRLSTVEEWPTFSIEPIKPEIREMIGDDRQTFDRLLFKFTAADSESEISQIAE